MLRHMKIVVSVDIAAISLFLANHFRGSAYLMHCVYVCLCMLCYLSNLVGCWCEGFHRGQLLYIRCGLILPIQSETSQEVGCWTWKIVGFCYTMVGHPSRYCTLNL